MAGEIIIGTGLDTKGFEKQLQALENKLEKQEIDLNITNIDYESAEKSLASIDKKIEENNNNLKLLNEEYDRLKQQLNSLPEGDSNRFLIYPKLSEINEQTSKLYNESDKLYNSWMKQFDVVSKIELKMDKQKIDIEETKQKMLGVYIEAQKVSNTIDMSKTIKNIGKGIDAIGKKLLKTGLLMMGIQSAMAMWRQSFNRVKEGHPELQKAVEHIQGAFDYIVSAFITRLEPYLPRLLEFADKILNIILQVGDNLLDVIFPILEGVVWLVEKIVDGLVWMYNNLGLLHYFTGTISTDTKEFSSNAEKFADNIRKANKETSKLRKQLMGFDEMNILNDDGTTGVANNIKKIIDDINKPDKNIDIKRIFGLDEPSTNQVNFITANQRHPIQELAKKWATDIEDGLPGTALGAVAITTIEQIADKVKKQGFEKTFLELAFGTKKENEKNSKNLLELVGVTIDGSKNERDNAIDYFKKQSWFQAMFGNNEELKKAAEDSVNTVGSMQNEIFEAIRKGSYKVKNGIVEIKLASGQTVKYSKEQFETLKTAVEGMGTVATNTAKKTETIGTTAKKVGEIGVQALDSITDSAETNSTETTSLWQRAWNLITQSNQTEGEKQKTNTSKNTKAIIDDTKTQVDNYNKNPKKANVQSQQDPKHNATTTTKEIKQDVDNANKNPPKAKVEIESPGKNALQKLHDKIKEALKFTLTFQGVQGTVGGALSIKGTATAKGGIISYPKLASGGIVNRPGKGVPLAYGGAIAGERGREAVIPLTDSGQMELLGQAIARNIIVNLTNEVKLDGKQLARYTSKAMSDMQFTSNGGVI